MRWAVALAVVASLGCAAFAQDESGHLVARKPDSHGATSADVMAERLEQTARDIDAQNATASRIAHFDLAWPGTRQERDALHGWTIILISAVTADATELPLSRAYLRSSNGDFPLAAIAQRRLDVPADSRLAKAVGRYRQDVFYLAPSDRLTGSGALMLDFAVHRQAFLLGQLPLDAPKVVSTAPLPVPGDPDVQAVVAMLQREFTGFSGLATVRSAP